jgi:hypothetical protein
MGQSPGDSALIYRERCYSYALWAYHIYCTFSYLFMFVWMNANILSSMLAVMTMNIGYFCSVLAGAFLGELAVGRFIQTNEHGH